MDKHLGTDDSREDEKHEASEDATQRRARSGPQDAEVACSSLTLPSNSKEKNKKNKTKERIQGKLGIDYFQIAAVVVWASDVAAEAFKMLNMAKQIAQEQRTPYTLKLGDEMVSVQPKGVGSGNDSHKEILFAWNGVEIAVSERNNATRQLSNASLTVSGTPCLVIGFATAWQFFHRIISALGGTIQDEWLRRVDICVDLPHLNYTEVLQPLVKERQFVCRLRKGSLNHEGERGTGYSIGSSNRVRVLIYDKRYEASLKHDSVYVAAMQQTRWHGKPKQAARVEWQMGREWLKPYGIDTPQNFVERIADVFDKLTKQVGGVFRLTATQPNRSQNRQSMAETHPVWARIVEIGKLTLGNVQEPLVRLDRSELDETRAIRQIVGFATSIADRRQKFCGTKQDVIAIIADALISNEVRDEQIETAFAKKANKSGTMQVLMAFPNKEAA